MTTLHIELSDGVRARLAARAVLQASVDVVASEEQLEDLLVARAGDQRPGIEFTPAFVDDFHAQVRARRVPGGRP